MNFDCSKLLVTTGGDKELAGELINIFLSEQEEMLEKVAMAVESGQAEELHAAAHKLKGSLGSLGAGISFDLTVALDTMAINKDLSQTKPALEKLRSAIESLVAELSNCEGALAK